MSKAKIPLVEATYEAQAFRSIIRDYVSVAVIAGSIRRQKERVGDIELVVQPRYVEEQVTLFDTAPVNQLALYLQSVADERFIKPRLNKNGHNIAWFPRDGSEPKFLAFTWNDIPIDLFIVNRDALDAWGYILWLRTGPGDANKLMVSDKYHGGMCPDDISMAGGFVWRRGHIVPIPNEETMFEVLQLAYVPPEQRSVEAYRAAREAWERSNVSSTGESLYTQWRYGKGGE